MRTLAMIAVFALAAFGQRHKLDEVDAGKPEGQLLEQFVGQYPKTPQTVWVLEQLQQYYAKAGQAEQAMAAGEKLLALDPEDPEAALQCLKAAEAEKNVALIEKYSELTFANARKDAAAPQPQDADKVEDWKREVDYAKQVAIYADYALFRAAAETRDPKLTIELAEMLQKRSPDSEYVPKMND